MNRKEKQEAKAERYRALARNSRQKADDACRLSNAAVENIPFGQPIHVGHHSEKAHRRAIEKSRQQMGKCVEYSNRAEYYEAKARSAELNNSIYLGDDDSVERLQAKLDALVEKQEAMKTTNKIVRSKTLSTEEKSEKLSQMGYSQNSIKELMTPYLGELGYPKFKLANNNARINDTRKRLERAKTMKSTENKEYSIGGCEIVENYQENRLQLFFSGVPDCGIREQLKRNGFRWSRFNGCWQSYLNRRQLDRVKEILTKE